MWPPTERDSELGHHLVSAVVSGSSAFDEAFLSYWCVLYVGLLDGLGMGLLG
jgi:hypothetical protein